MGYLGFNVQIPLFFFTAHLLSLLKYLVNIHWVPNTVLGWGRRFSLLEPLLSQPEVTDTSTNDVVGKVL